MTLPPALDVSSLASNTQLALFVVDFALLTNTTSLLTMKIVRDAKTLDDLSKKSNHLVGFAPISDVETAAKDMFQTLQIAKLVTKPFEIPVFVKEACVRGKNTPAYLLKL